VIVFLLRFVLVHHSTSRRLLGLTPGARIVGESVNNFTVLLISILVTLIWIRLSNIKRVL